MKHLINCAAKTAILLSAVTVLAASCKRELSPDVIVSVGSSDLTLEKLRAVMPKGLSEADSVAFADSYISSWISDHLITEVALKNLPDTREIDRMTEDYRRSLIMWEYMRMKVAQDPDLAISHDSIAAYYAAHSSEFITSEPLVRGIYVRLASDSRSLADVKRWYKSSSDADIDRLEKVGIREDNVDYDYFRDRWIPWSQVRTVWPAGVEIVPQSGGDYESEVNGFIHLLHISDMLPIGSLMPEEAAEPLVTRRLESMRRADLEQRLRTDLRRKAESDGQIRWKEQDN